MNNWLYFLMFAIAIGFLTQGCSQTNDSFLSKTTESVQDDRSQHITHNRSGDLKWLHYADPKVDASLAIQKQDFALLAFAGRATSIPGINNESSSLRKHCGYQLIAGSGDVLKSKNDLKLRKQLYIYAATYNQLVATACQKINVH